MRYDWVFLLLVAGSASGAQIYRFVAADGEVTYSDRPGGENAEMIYVDTATSTPIAAEEVTADGAPTETGSASEDGETNEPVGAEPTDEEISAERLENCGIARDREERYLVAHRIYRDADGGEREYLNDEELDAIRAQAVTDVEKWCD